MNIRENSKRAYYARIALITFIVLSAISSLAVYWEISELKALPNAYGFSEEEVTTYDLAALVSGLLAFMQMGVNILCIVLFIRWFRRAYWNLHALKAPSLSYSEGWAAGGWFVPFLNLVRPYQIMKEIWENLSYLKKNTFASNGTLLASWWGFYIAGSVLGNLSGRLSLNADTVSDHITANYLLIGSSVLDITAGYLVISILNAVTELEEEVYLAKRQSTFTDDRLQEQPEPTLS